MGTYTLVVEGHGVNQNGTPKDADELLKDFVQRLKAAGQEEVKAAFIYGPKLVESTVRTVQTITYNHTTVKTFE